MCARVKVLDKEALAVAQPAYLIWRPKAMAMRACDMTLATWDVSV
jgi:citrate lyase gamma subunit